MGRTLITLDGPPDVERQSRWKQRRASRNVIMNDRRRKIRSADEDAQLAALVAMSDDDIDTVDMPEAPKENWAFARRPGLYKPIKRHVTMRLDADVLDWFKERAGGRGYQTEINRVLGQHVATGNR